MFIVDSNGDIELYQGDSGHLFVEGLPTDQSYTLYFAIYNQDRHIMSESDPVPLNGASVKDVFVKAELTDSLTVPADEEYGTYYYGLKLCTPATEEEDTLVINDGDIGDLNMVRVYPKKVEGLE